MTAQGAWVVASSLILRSFRSTCFVPIFGVLGRLYQALGTTYQSQMATIRTRKKADGSTGYLVQIRIYREKVTVYQESQTFARKQAAVAWAKRRETKLAEPGAIERATQVWHTVKEMIGHYLVEAEKARPLGETKRRRTTTWVSRSIPTSLSRCWWTMPYALCPMPYGV
ncbi:hypothetical protein METHP14_180039 [Pseudomonas sp. P14-2025]